MKTNPCIDCNFEEQRQKSEWIFCKKANEEKHVYFLRNLNCYQIGFQKRKKEEERNNERN